MHQLHLVGFTAEHDGLIFSTKKGATSGSYVVAFDDALFSALEDGRKAAMADPEDAAARAAAERVRALRPTQHSNLSVRDIQARLRSGLSLAQVAAEAGVDEAWVARFAAPVLAEQAAVVERAMALFFTTPRKGTSSRPLGEAVRWNLIDKGVVVDTSPQGPGWSAFQLEPGRWGLRFTYTSRGRNQVAEWEVDVEAGELTGRNRQASELAYVEAGARRRKPAEVAPAPQAPVAKKATAGRKGTPARTKTARAQAARATSTKAAAARAKAAKPAAQPPRTAAGGSRGKPVAAASARGKQAGGSADAGKGRATAGSSGRGAVGATVRKATATPASTGTGRRAGQPVAPTPAPKRAGTTVGRSGSNQAGRSGGATSDKATPAARFPAPRPASARPAEPGTAPRPRPRPVPPAARQPEPRPAPPPAPEPAPAPRPAPSEPAVRRVTPPPRRPEPPTADARPMPTVAQQPAEAPAAETPPSVIRRLPTPAPAASFRRTGRGSAATAAAPAAAAPAAAAAAAEPEPVPATPSPETQPPPDPPRPTPGVRPVGGGDGRPTILIIDADRAGDRRRS